MSQIRYYASKLQFFFLSSCNQNWDEKSKLDDQSRFLSDTCKKDIWLTQFVHTRVIYDRVRNTKNYFEIAAFLNFERGTSRAGNSNENISVAGSVTLL